MARYFHPHGHARSACGCPLPGMRGHGAFPPGHPECDGNGSVDRARARPGRCRRSGDGFPCLRRGKDAKMFPTRDRQPHSGRDMVASPDMLQARCPGCDKHCPLDAPGCRKGEAVRALLANG